MDSVEHCSGELLLTAVQATSAQDFNVGQSSDHCLTHINSTKLLLRFIVLGGKKVVFCSI